MKTLTFMVTPEGNEVTALEVHGPVCMDDIIKKRLFFYKGYWLQPTEHYEAETRGSVTKIGDDEYIQAPYGLKSQAPGATKIGDSFYIPRERVVITDALIAGQTPCCMLLCKAKGLPLVWVYRVVGKMAYYRSSSHFDKKYGAIPVKELEVVSYGETPEEIEPW